MSALRFWFALVIGLGLYLYVGWLSSDAAPRSAKGMAKFAALSWALATGAGLYAWFWGATRGLSAYQTFFNSTPGKFQNWVDTVYSLVVVAACFSIHAIAAFSMRDNRGVGKGGSR
jgi:hypothetical protein